MLSGSLIELLLQHSSVRAEHAFRGVQDTGMADQFVQPGKQQVRLLAHVALERAAGKLLVRFQEGAAIRRLRRVRMSSGKRYPSRHTEPSQCGTHGTSGPFRAHNRMISVAGKCAEAWHGVRRGERTRDLPRRPLNSCSDMRA